MYRFIAFIVSFATGSLAAWQVYINLNEIVDHWLVTIGFTAGVFLFVTLILYLPLLRHIADIIEEKFSTIGVRLTSTKTGVNLDEIPQVSHSRLPVTTSSNKVLCGICGGPGGPVCDSCHQKMSSK
jgi:hypothetical protein